MAGRSRLFPAFLVVLHFVAGALYAGQNSNSPAEESGYVTSDDGVRLFYRKIGSGPQIVIIPLGFMLFQDFQVLATGRTMIFYDMRDRGKSDEVKDPAKITIQKDVDDLEAVRRHFRADKVALIGESYLGMVVILYTTQHSGHVERIVQIGPVSRRFGAKYPPEYTASDSGQVPDPAELKKLNELQKHGYAAAHPKDFCQEDWQVERTGLVGNPANAVKAGDGYCEFPNEWPTRLDKHFEASISSIQKLDIHDSDLARVKIPVLTIHGTKDRNAPYGGGREWAATLTNARLVTVAGAAHFPWLDNPDLVFSSIDVFLRGEWPRVAEKISTPPSAR